MSLEFNNPLFLGLGILLIVMGLIDLFIANSSLSIVADGFSIIAGAVLIIRYFISKK
tara:strand:- start:91 stop:261 length:171 start_codon:yes stop_codon:yes gene_type:complete